MRRWQVPTARLTSLSFSLFASFLLKFSNKKISIGHSLFSNPCWCPFSALYLVCRPNRFFTAISVTYYHSLHRSNSRLNAVVFPIGSVLNGTKIFPIGTLHWRTYSSSCIVVRTIIPRLTAYTYLVSLTHRYLLSLS